MAPRGLFEGDEERQSVLRMVRGDSEALMYLDEEHRRDPDIILAAVAGAAGALCHASQDLCQDRDFALEVVRRNWRALEFLPEFQEDRGVVLAAASRSLDALRLAPESLRQDAELAAEAAAAWHTAALTPAALDYEGEALRLVGYCNNWRTTDSSLRFCKRALGGALVGAEGEQAHQSAGTRHELTVHLHDGCLSFQVISCTRCFGFRIFPVRAGPDGFFRLVPGDTSAVVARIGGHDDGHGHNFYIEEEAGVTVSIHLELRNTNSADLHVAVWCSLEMDACPMREIVSLAQGRDRQKPKFDTALPDFVEVAKSDKEPSNRAKGRRLFKQGGDNGHRQSLLDALERNGRLLERLSEEFRRDADLVLAAVANSAEAILHACSELRDDRTFAFEVVQRNWRALRFLPDSLRCDNDVVLRAARCSLEALDLASKSFRECPKFQVQAAAQQAMSREAIVYEDEYLRLVGYCNDWRIADSELRFYKMPPDELDNQGNSTDVVRGGDDGGNACSDAPTRHRLTAHLRDGRLSFQVVSCTRGFGLRIFPVKVDPDGFYRVGRGREAAIAAVAGGEDDGHGQNFFLKEVPGALVTIYLELGGDAGNWPAVWYVLEQQRQKALVSLAQPRDCQKPRPAGTTAEEVRVMEDAEAREGTSRLIHRATGLSKRRFAEEFPGRHLSLLVDSASVIPTGYCIYRLLKAEGFLFIDRLCILPPFRRQGLGRVLMQWAIAQAVEQRCCAVRLTSGPSAMLFYRAMGFEAVSGQHLEFRLPGASATGLILPRSEGGMDPWEPWWVSGVG